MGTNRLLNGQHVYLRQIRLSDADKDYCSWLNDPHVNRFLESRFQRWTIKKLKSYIKDIKANKSSFFFAIIRKDSGKHIGNIKLGPVNLRHKYGEIGIVIGDRSSWGRGFATEAIKLVKDHAFNTLKLHKVTAGIYCENIGSVKAFQKAGFHIEGIQKKHYLYKNKYINGLLLASIKE